VGVVDVQGPRSSRGEQATAAHVVRRQPVQLIRLGGSNLLCVKAVEVKRPCRDQMNLQ
jgi:hypothetical protein